MSNNSIANNSIANSSIASSSSSTSSYLQDMGSSKWDCIRSHGFQRRDGSEPIPACR
jgi:hypothetical protein